MKYGDEFTVILRDRITGERIPCSTMYKRTAWEGYHTNDLGDGLWYENKQIIGTCDFTVRGCKTEKSAKAKIRNYISTSI